MTKFEDYEKISEEEGVGKGSSDWLKLEDGENKVRFVTETQSYGKHYSQKLKKNFICIGENCALCLQGHKKQVRFVGWVIDRKDEKLKLLEIGWQVFKQMGELAKSSEYGFKGLPPFDIIIKKTGEGLDTEYFVQPARKEVGITEKEEKEIKKLTSPALIVEKMLEKSPAPSVEEGKDEEAKAELNGKPQEEIDIKDIPF